MAKTWYRMRFYFPPKKVRQFWLAVLAPSRPCPDHASLWQGAVYRRARAGIVVVLVVVLVVVSMK